MRRSEKMWIKTKTDRAQTLHMETGAYYELVLSVGTNAGEIRYSGPGDAGWVGIFKGTKEEATEYMDELDRVVSARKIVLGTVVLEFSNVD